MAEGLQPVGFDVVTVADLRLSGRTDAEVLGAAVVSGCVVLTQSVSRDWSPNTGPGAATTTAS